MSAIMICVAELLNPTHSPNSKGEIYRIWESERETYQPWGTLHIKSFGGLGVLVLTEGCDEERFETIGLVEVIW
ncbi:hypothetical protein OAE44_00545 [bacterium]|nr:hypothetical protein [bacterium]